VDYTLILKESRQSWDFHETLVAEFTCTLQTQSLIIQQFARPSSTPPDNHHNPIDDSVSPATTELLRHLAMEKSRPRLQVPPFCLTSRNLWLDATDASISTCPYYKVLFDDTAQCVTTALANLQKEEDVDLFNHLSPRLPYSIVSHLDSTHRNSGTQTLLALRSLAKVSLIEDTTEALYTSWIKIKYGPHKFSQLTHDASSL